MCNSVTRRRVCLEWRGPSAIFGPSALLGTLDQPLDLASILDQKPNGKPGPISNGGDATVAELEFQLRETEQLLEITLLKKKLRDTELAMSSIIAQMSTVAKDQVSEPGNWAIEAG